MISKHKNILASAVVTILRPLIRILIRNEMTHLELTELVRQTYVQVADEQYKLPDQEMTISRVAVLTGLSRKEVVRIRALLLQEEIQTRASLNRAQRVVQGWLSDSDFLDSKNAPKELPIKGPNGSFVTLVARYSGDITYGAILEELSRVGIIEHQSNGRIKLINSGYVPHADELEKVRIASLCVSDMFKTAVHNIESPIEDAYFQRQLVYNNVNESLVEEFQNIAKTRSIDLLNELNTFLIKAREDIPVEQRSPEMRVGIGIYYLENTPKSQNGTQDENT